MSFKCLLNFFPTVDYNYFYYFLDFNIYFLTGTANVSQCPKQNLISVCDDGPMQHRPVLLTMGLW